MRVERSVPRPFRFSWLNRFWSKSARPAPTQSKRFGLKLESLEDRSVPASIPVLNSFPSAPATIFLDFDGSVVDQWGSFSNITTPAYTVDGDSSTNFSDIEVAHMRAIFEVVAEDYAPFNINVTTVDPGTYPVNVALHIAIGGNASWNPAGGALGGIALINSFSTASSSRTVFVFSENLANLLSDPLYDKEIGAVASHESGHAFGLQHQSLYTNGTLTDVYHPGINGWGPIMGAPYGMAMETWWNGPTPSGETALQDDMSIISNSTNAFGYRTDDHGNAAGTATTLTAADLNNPFLLNATGVIAENNDVDVFSFTTGPGQVNISLSPFSSILGAPNLVSVIELRDSSGALIAASTGANPNSINSPTLTQTLSAGSYRVFVRSEGTYGRVGQYKLQVVTPITGPTIASSTPSGVQNKPIGAIDFVFDQAMDPTSFDLASDVFSFVGPGNVDLLSQITGFSWLDSRTLRVTFNFQISNGDYTMQIGPNIRSQNQLNMDQNLDGTQGSALDRYTATFRIAIFGGAPDRFEPNNSLPTAYNFGDIRNLSEKNLSVHATFNDDYFQFTAATSGTYTVTINFNNDDGDLDLFTFNTQGIVNGFSTTTNNFETITLNAVGGFTYFIRVTGFFGSASPNYGMKIAGPTALSDRFEPNNSLAAAANFGTVRARTERGLSIGNSVDQDYFTFTAAITGRYEVSTAFFNDFGDIDLEVSNSGGVLATSNGTTDGEKVFVDLIAGQQYTIRVYGFNSAINNYDMAIKALGRTDIVGRDATTGALWVGLANNAGQLSTSPWGVWSTNVTWEFVRSGDFNGDGWADLAGRIKETGDWYVAISNGSNSYTTTKWGSWSLADTFRDVVVGDFNGDGRADLAGRTATQQWNVLLAAAAGNGFLASANWGNWNTAINWLDVRAGDFDGDGRTDVVGRNQTTGEWQVGLSNGTSAFSAGIWSKWASVVAWADVLVGDFNGDGRADLTGRWAESGQWYTALSNGPSGFVTSLWASWSPHVASGPNQFSWLDVRVGDFDGDGRSDITGRDSIGGTWWTGLSGTGANANRFVTSYFGGWSVGANVHWVDVQVGDFDGDGKSDIIGRWSETGQWWTGMSITTSFFNTYRSAWTTGITWADVRAAEYGN